MFSTLYRGSVKDIVGPVQQPSSAVIFEYTDSFSVFDWGRMPDTLPRKGEALAILASDLFERLEQAESWREFSRSAEAFALRKANRFGSAFNEVGEELQSRGLRTHYLGVLEPFSNSASNSMEFRTFKVDPKPLSSMKSPFRRLVVRQVSVVKPLFNPIFGRILPDYRESRVSPLPRLVPLEAVFRYACPKGSSLIDRAARDSTYLDTLGFPNLKAEPGAQWEFPVIELFTKLEPTDRPVGLTEALAITGLSSHQLQEILFKTVWVSGLLRSWFARHQLELVDGKLEWGLSEEGEAFLVDAIGPDELRILKNGVHLSKEFLRDFYRKSSWYDSIEMAKLRARKLGVLEWKRWVRENPPLLSPQYREQASQVYLSLTNELTGRRWFHEAKGVDRVVDSIRRLKEGGLH